MGCEPGPPLGIGLSGLPPATSTVVPLRYGDVILAYADGATEARDALGNFYPLADRLTALLAEGSDASPRAVVDAVWDALQRCTGMVYDDVALLALAVTGAAANTLPDQAGPRHHGSGLRPPPP